MPALRELLTGAGFGDVRTYVQSGNVVLTSERKPDALAPSAGPDRRAFGLEIAVVVRTRDELAEVVRRDPLGAVAERPKRYQVSFLAPAPAPSSCQAGGARRRRRAVRGHRPRALHVARRGRRPLDALGRHRRPELGVTATARNWTTVTTLLEMADE